MKALRVAAGGIALLAVAVVLLYHVKQNPVAFEDVRKDVAALEPEMADIPGGTFTMGDDARGRPIERPAHPVDLSPFRIGKYEVTNEEYRRFCDATGRTYPVDPDFAEVNPIGKDYFESLPRYPVIMVSWDDMRAYCAWLSARTGKDYHLPTEAQWERAARGGAEGLEYPWGNEKDPSRARIMLKWSEGPVEVGRYPPNGYGLHDMAGNVGEATADWYDEGYYARSPRKDPTGPSGLANYHSLVHPWKRSRLKGRCHVVRGGSFRAPWDGVMIAPDGRPELSCQTFGRDWLYQQPYTHFDLGFRVAEGGVWR
jgi:formylglycine-generating enzyme required for sulfatase activity